MPTLLSSTPSDGSRAVKLDQNIVLKFSEAVTAGSGKIKPFDGADRLVEAFISIDPMGTEKYKNNAQKYKKSLL